MRIWALIDGIEKEAYKINGNFDCYPISTNEKREARIFTTVEDAAIFLLSNPAWGIRMNPGSAIVYRGIQISRD